MHNFLFIPCSHWKAMRAAGLCAVRCCLWLCALQNTLERKAATNRCGCCSSICWLAVYVLPTEMQTPRVLFIALCPDPSIHPPFLRGPQALFAARLPLLCVLLASGSKTKHKSNLSLSRPFVCCLQGPNLGRVCHPSGFEPRLNTAGFSFILRADQPKFLSAVSFPLCKQSRDAH